MTTSPFGLALGIDGVGWHPAAERFDSQASAADPEFWRDHVLAAETAGFDVVTFEDAPAIAQPGHSARLDSFALANWLAPQTSTIGLVPAGTTALQEPFHVATATQTLDFASQGRAGLRFRIGLTPEEYAAVGREGLGTIAYLKSLSQEEQSRVLREPFVEGWEFTEIVRLLWDSWQDDAEIRDIDTGRFLDAERIHNPEYRGEHLAVHGASITPRSPQGQPPVFALAHQQVPYEFAAAAADVVFITPFDEADLARRRAGAEAAIESVQRRGTRLQIWADIAVSVGDEGAARLDELNDIDGQQFETDTGTFVGTSQEIADLVVSYYESGLDGVRLRPVATAADLAALTTEVLPELQRAGISVAAPEATTLRERLGLPVATNRFIGDAPFTADFRAATKGK